MVQEATKDVYVRQMQNMFSNPPHCGNLEMPEGTGVQKIRITILIKRIDSSSPGYKCWVLIYIYLVSK